jgi:hypothetical protein
MVMFRMLVLQSLYTLSDEQVEYQVRGPATGRVLLSTEHVLDAGSNSALPAAADEQDDRRACYGTCRGHADDARARQMPP